MHKNFCTDSKKLFEILNSKFTLENPPFRGGQSLKQVRQFNYRGTTRIMRAKGRDITELFGYSPDDHSSTARDARNLQKCPFSSSSCTKTNHDKSIIYGVCSVSEGSTTNPGRDVIICPKRLYHNDLKIIQNIAIRTWGERFEFISGGSMEDLRNKIKTSSNPNVVVAFGHNSGKEISINAGAQMSMDWILQTYNNGMPKEFIGIEVQSIDITGNYRNNHKFYMNSTQDIRGDSLIAPNSEHGLNWANVHKRLIPQLIRKGNIYKNDIRCKGFYFILPEVVYERFENILGYIKEQEGSNRNNITIATVSLESSPSEGTPRKIKFNRFITYSIESIKEAFGSWQSSGANSLLNEILMSVP